MAVSASTFKSRFTEFDTLQDSDVQPHLDSAERRTNRKAYGSNAKGDDAVMLRAAHTLSLGQSGRHNRLVSREQEGDTTYMRELRRMQREVSLVRRTS